MDSLKDEIIYNIFEYLENGNLMYANRAKDFIQDIAKKYHVILKKTKDKQDLKVIFKRFILNKEGYRELLPILFNSI